jgi:hypothetical protein
MAGAFVPEPLAEPIVGPNTATQFRRAAYISPSEYKEAPTAVSTAGLVPGAGSESQLSELAAVIARASGWVDEICFHRADGTLAASPSTESGWITPKGLGELQIICNYKPILQVDAMALGPNPQNLQNITQELANEITIQEPVLYVPASGGSWGPTTWYPPSPTGANGKIWAVWSYVNGYPHTSLATTAAQGATSITVAPSVPGGAVVWGVYAGTLLTIRDGQATEQVVVERVEGLTLHLTAGLLYAHTVPAAPNNIRVTAIPWVVEQACISLTSCLVKTRGTRAMVMPSAPGGGPAHQELMQAGGLQDFEVAFELLKPYIVPYIRST